LNRRIILLNLALLALAAALIWLLRTHWSDARSREAKVLTQRVPAKSVLAPPPPPPVKQKKIKKDKKRRVYREMR